MTEPQETMATAQPGLPLLPAHMAGRPFGIDEEGKPVGRTKGSIVRSTVDYMLDCAA
jgi:hypothetical protein